MAKKKAKTQAEEMTTATDIEQAVEPKKEERMESKELAKKESTALAAAPAGDAWGHEGLDNKDLMIPKLLLMQGLSEAVADEKAMMGDIINSVTLEKLGDRKNPVEIIPISTFKTWVVSFREEGATKFEYRGTIPMTADNDKLPLEEDGVDEKTGAHGTIRRDRTINFYVLIASQVEGGAALPHVLSCRRTSYTAGKKVATHFATMQMLRQPPAAKTLKLTCKGEKNDLGNYYIFDVEQGRKTSADEIATAKMWYDVLKQGTHKVDESDVAKEEKEVESTPF